MVAFPNRRFDFTILPLLVRDKVRFFAFLSKQGRLVMKAFQRRNRFFGKRNSSAKNDGRPFSCTLENFSRCKKVKVLRARLHKPFSPINQSCFFLNCLVFFRIARKRESREGVSAQFIAIFGFKKVHLFLELVHCCIWQSIFEKIFGWEQSPCICKGIVGLSVMRNKITWLRKTT